MISKTCKDNVNWLYNKGRKDKSIEKTVYMPWEEDQFSEKFTLPLEYGGDKKEYNSPPVEGRFTLVTDQNIEPLMHTFGPAELPNKSRYYRQYVIYAALDMMSFVYKTTNPHETVSVMGVLLWLVELFDKAASLRVEKRHLQYRKGVGLSRGPGSLPRERV